MVLASSPVAENNAAHNTTSNSKTVISKSFEYTTKLIARTPNNNDILDAGVVVPLKYLSNFWRSVDLPLINCEIGLDVSCSKECLKSEISIIPTVAGNPNARPPTADRPARQTTGARFQINNAKLYVPVVTLSINNIIKFLENIKKGFKRTISWNKYRSEITIQPKILIGCFYFYSKMVTLILRDILLISITCHY